MKEITRKQFMGGMAATVALGWRGTFAAPMRRQRNYDDMTWWDPYVEDIDSLNKRYGKGKVFSARHSLTLGLARSNREPRLRGGYAEGLGDRSWKMKRGKLSKRPTTRWDELMVVR